MNSCWCDYDIGFVKSTLLKIKLKGKINFRCSSFYFLNNFVYWFSCIALGSLSFIFLTCFNIRPAYSTIIKPKEVNHETYASYLHKQYAIPHSSSTHQNFIST